MDWLNTGFYSTCEEVVGATSTITRCYNPAISFASILGIVFLGLVVAYGFLRIMK